MYKEGDIITNLTLETSEGETIEVGKGKWIILYFYPKDDTPGCTIQAKKFSELYEEFDKLNSIIVGVSKDNPERHKKFCQKYGLKIKLVTDKESKIASLFGVNGKIFFSRDTVIINPVGKVMKIWRKVSPSQNPYDSLNFIKENS
ncbi:MAG: peroxiredoxin [bacterium]